MESGRNEGAERLGTGALRDKEELGVRLIQLIDFFCLTTIDQSI